MKKILVTFGKDETPTYLESLRAVGVEPVPVHADSDSAGWRSAFARCEALLLTGGGDVEPERYGLVLPPGERAQFIRGSDAARDEMELELARKAVQADMPVLAICRGIQVLNVALGGTLFYDVPTQIGEKVCHHRSDMAELAHGVRWETGARLTRVLGGGYLQVNSSHHQALARVAGGLVPIAWSDDGVIEAVENPLAKFVVGVQFHPERLWQKYPEFLQLFRLFAAA